MPSVSVFAECQTTGTRQRYGLPSARPRTLSRNLAHGMPARALPSAGRRQIKALGNVSPLPSAGRAALGKARARAQHARPPCSARQGADGVNSLPSASSWHSAKVKYYRVSPAGTRQSRNVAACAGVALGKASFAQCWCSGTRQTWLKIFFGPSNFFGLHLNLIM